MFKLSVGVNDFTHVLAMCGKCIDAKAVMPIMSNVLISSNENGFFVTSANMEMRIEMPIEMSIESGEFAPFCVNYDKLSNAVSTLTKGSNITLSIGDKKMEVVHDMGKFAVPIDNPNDYPTSSILGEDIQSFKCDYGILSYHIAMAKAHISTDMIRPQLCSLCLDVIGDKMNVVSTNGYSIYLKKNISIESDSEQNIQLLIPSRAINAIIGVFADSDMLEFTTDRKRVMIKNDNGVKFIAILSEGNFVPYERAIPNIDDTNSIVVNKNQLLNTMKRANVFTNAMTNLVVFSRQGSDFCVSCEDIDFAISMSEKTPILNNENVTIKDGFRIGASLVHINNVLNAIKTDDVIFKFNTPEQAFTLQEQDGDDDKVLVLMPMKIN